MVLRLWWGRAMPEKFVSRGFLANTAAVVAEVFTSPTEDSVVYTVEPAEPSAAKGPHAGSIFDQIEKQKPKVVRATTVASNFKLIFLSIFALTIILLAADIVLAVMLTQPTSSEVNLISTVDTVFKACAGAMLGLLGGKVT